MSSTYHMPPIGGIDTKDNVAGKTEAHIANCNMSEKSTYSFLFHYQKIQLL